MRALYDLFFGDAVRRGFNFSDGSFRFGETRRNRL